MKQGWWPDTIEVLPLDVAGKRAREGGDEQQQRQDKQRDSEVRIIVQDYGSFTLDLNDDPLTWLPEEFDLEFESWRPTRLSIKGSEVVAYYPAPGASSPIEVVVGMAQTYVRLVTQSTRFPVEIEISPEDSEDAYARWVESYERYLGYSPGTIFLKHLLVNHYPNPRVVVPLHIERHGLAGYDDATTFSKITNGNVMSLLPEEQMEKLNEEYTAIWKGVRRYAFWKSPIDLSELPAVSSEDRVREWGGVILEAHETYTQNHFEINCKMAGIAPPKEWRIEAEAETCARIMFQYYVRGLWPRVSEPMLVGFRGFRRLGTLSRMEDFPGLSTTDHFVERKFVSCSAKWKVSLDTFGGAQGVLNVIQMPRDTPYLPIMDDSASPQEREFLLPPGTHLRRLSYGERWITGRGVSYMVVTWVVDRVVEPPEAVPRYFVPALALPVSAEYGARILPGLVGEGTYWSTKGWDPRVYPGFEIQPNIPGRPPETIYVFRDGSFAQSGVIARGFLQIFNIWAVDEQRRIVVYKNRSYNIKQWSPMGSNVTIASGDPMCACSRALIDQRGDLYIIAAPTTTMVAERVLEWRQQAIVLHSGSILHIINYGDGRRQTWRQYDMERGEFVSSSSFDGARIEIPLIDMGEYRDPKAAPCRSEPIIPGKRWLVYTDTTIYVIDVELQTFEQLMMFTHIVWLRYDENQRLWVNYYLKPRFENSCLQAYDLSNECAECGAIGVALRETVAPYRTYCSQECRPKKYE